MPTSTHRIDKLPGPSGSFGGWVILLTGLVAIFASWTAIFLVLTGAFAAFTTTMSVIDFRNRRVKYVTALFGLIRLGNWTAVDGTMTLRVRQSGRRQRRRRQQKLRLCCRYETPREIIRFNLPNKVNETTTK